MANRERIDVAALIARQCIAVTLGVDVEVHDVDGKQGAHDLAFAYDGRDCAAEVKLVVDPAQREVEAKAGKFGYRVDNRLRHSWTVYLSPGRRWNTALTQIPALLSRVEVAGDKVLAHPWRRGELSEHLDRIGVDDLVCVPPTEKHPPGYYVMPAPWGGGVPSMDEAVASACQHLASQVMRKIRKQLANAQADEKHAFLFYGWEYMEAIPFSRDDEFPRAAPQLPAGVDALWLTSTLHESAVVVWLPDRGWLRAARLGWNNDRVS
ncbi:hypothetical protein [Streptomyces sp. ISL-11]|uniref:hypothetical protein n=1 Tax=Streptomyces sp. ISL-11 TaxID=2819174 RepID=UPI001BE7F1AC|nr:hypothetical protein [Streptomyces sp. ISL-11]MBT2383676.1 hypothetical protein [Streptomyces sp. ISL-11]